MNKKSIGILAYYWPPAGGSGVQRWLRFSNQLCNLGWDVHVFTFSNPTEFPNTFTLLQSLCALYLKAIAKNMNIKILNRIR